MNQTHKQNKTKLNQIYRPASYSHINQTTKNPPRVNSQVYPPPPLVFRNKITEYMVTGNNVFELYVSKVFPSSLVFLDSKFKFDILHGSFAYTVILT